MKEITINLTPLLLLFKRKKKERRRETTIADLHPDNLMVTGVSARDAAEAMTRTFRAAAMPPEGDYVDPRGNQWLSKPRPPKNRKA